MDTEKIKDQAETHGERRGSVGGVVFPRRQRQGCLIELQKQTHKIKHNK